MTVLKFERKDISKIGTARRFLNRVHRPGNEVSFTDTTQIGVCDITGKICEVFQFVSEVEQVFTVDVTYRKMFHEELSFDFFIHPWFHRNYEYDVYGTRYEEALY